MAKKTIDTSNWIASDSITPKINTSDWIPVETPVEQDFNIENVQKRFEQDPVREQALRKDLDQYEGLNEQEKKYLIDKNLKGELKGADFSQTLFTMAGLMPEQKKVLTKDAKGNKIYADEKDMFDIFEEQKKDFNYDKLVSDLTSKIQTSGKNSYYMKDKGDGTLVAVPLAINEKPEAKDVKGAQVFSSLDDDAIGDSRFADVAKKAYNIIPSVAQGFISIPETVQGLVTGKTGGTYKLLKSALEEGKFKTTQEFQKGILDTEKIDEFSDFLSKDVYGLSGDKILNTVVNVASSLGEFALTRKMVPLKGKAGTFAAGIAMNIKEPLQAAEDAGVEGRGKYAVAATYALAASAIETLIGIEGKIFDDAATTAKKEMINKIIKDNVEVVGGKLTKESVENLYKETLKEIPSFYTKYAKNTIGEVTEEVAQNMIQNGAQEIHDIVMKDDPESAKFNTKFWSPEALGEYINSAAGGLIGGMGGSLFIKNKQSQTAYDAIKDGKENELKVQLTSGLKEGRLTKDDYDRAIFKINSYKEYYDATKDRNVTDEERRKIFDLTYEKENLKTGLENIKQNNPGGINDGLIATKEQELSDYNQQVNDIWSSAEARTATSPVEEAKAEVPMWKTELDTFSKEVGNKDKQVSQKSVTRDNIQTSIGATPELNELAKPFSVDFKAPHLPEDAGNIQIRDGVLYEPYLVKQEGKDDVVETRQLPVYAMEDKDGGTWLFAVGEKTDLDAPDVSYLIKLNEEGNYEGHQEFKYETAKKNELTFDDIVPTFNKLGIKTSSISDEIKGLGLVPQAEFEEVEEVEEVPEEKEIVESELFKQIYETVKSGVNKAKLKLLPNKTVGVTINGVDVPFASQSLLNKEDLPSGDVEVNVRTVENIKDKNGKNVGRGVLVETQEGIPLGYIRRAGKAQAGRVSVEKISETEDIDIDVPVELSDVAKEKLQQIEKDQSDYELVEDELGRRYVNKKTGETYTSVSSFVSGKSGGDFKGDNRLKETAFKVGNIINGIVKDFFNGTIKAYSNYAENISRDDYDDIIRQLQDVLEYAKEKGYSIITKPMIIADDVNKIAGQPNLIMVDENGKFYVYDVATLRNRSGIETKELLNKRYKDRPTNAERISAQVNILADILNNKYGIEVGRVGVIPFDVDYEVAKKEQPVQITQAVRAKRVDFKRKQILKPTGKTSAEQVQEKVAEVKPAEEKVTEVKPKETVKEEFKEKPVEEKIKTKDETMTENGSLIKNEVYSVPVLLTSYDRAKGIKQTYITKDVIEKAYENDKSNNPKFKEASGQTIESIIRRGGYGLKELDVLLPNWKNLIKEKVAEGAEEKVEESKPKESVKEGVKEKPAKSKEGLPIDAKGREVGSKEYKSGENHVNGRQITRTAPNGTKIKGRYKLVPAAQLIPSHNPNSFSKNEKFPQTKEGKTINDRDYEKDKPAQGQVKSIAQNFSAAALDQSPVVSKEGIVYDGNNRTMSRQLAAQNNTDSEYLDELKERAEMYGFTAEDVDKIENPTLVFEVEENMPFDTKTMAMFNVVEKKAQSPIQRAVAISKRLSDKAKISLSALYEQVDTPSEVTSDPKMMKQAVDILVAEGVIDSKEIPRYVSENGVATPDGVSFLEGVVMAATLNEDSIQAISSEGMGDVKRMILSNIVGLMQNSAKGKDSLINEIAGAIQIMQKAKSLKIPLTDFLSQPDIFNENNFTLGEMSMALLLNTKKPNELKGFLKNYNQDVGIENLFGEDTSKQGILDRLLNDIISNYDKVKKNISAIAKERSESARRGGEQAESKGEDFSEQKAKSVKSIFDEAVKLFYKIRGTEGAAKKRNLTQERKDLLKENPSVKFIDNNINSIFEQLEKKGIIKRKGDCP